MEIKVSLPDWAERIELSNSLILKRLDLNEKIIIQNIKQLQQFSKLLSEATSPQRPLKLADKMVV